MKHSVRSGCCWCCCDGCCCGAADAQGGELPRSTGEWAQQQEAVCLLFSLPLQPGFEHNSKMWPAGSKRAPTQVHVCAVDVLSGANRQHVGTVWLPVGARLSQQASRRLCCHFPPADLLRTLHVTHMPSSPGICWHQQPQANNPVTNAAGQRCSGRPAACCAARRQWSSAPHRPAPASARTPRRPPVRAQRHPPRYSRC